MARNRIIQQYDFRFEVLPPVAVGILLNLVGRFVCGYLASHGVPLADQLFVDMSGTAYTAILVGPWWAALVGVISNAISGNFFSVYFPYAIVNVLGALAWGSIASAFNVRKRITERSFSMRARLLTYLGLALAGAVTCGLASSAVHLALLIPMGHPLTAGAVYDFVRASMGPLQGQTNEIAILFIGDFMRDLIDKSVDVAAALIAVSFSYPIPTATRHLPLLQRLKSDPVSILVFTLTYGAYLLVARITWPTIRFGEGDTPVDWLQKPWIISLLYVPIGLALLAFLCLSFASENDSDRSIDARRLARTRLLRRLTTPIRWLIGHTEMTLKTAQGLEIYALIASVATWPFGSKEAGELSAFGVAYFGVVGSAVGYYFYQIKQFSERYREASSQLTNLQKWVRVTNGETSESFLNALSALLIGDKSMREGAPLVSGTIAYKLAYLAAATLFAEGEEEPPLAGEVATSSARIILLAVVAGGRVVDDSVRKDLDRLMARLRLHTVFLVSLSVHGHDAELIHWLRSTWRRNIEIALVSWHDIENAIVSAGRRENVMQILIRARVRTLELISEGKPMGASKGAGLALRAIPALVHVIDHLPRNSMVFDLGAGRGRHTLYALRAGHTVLAVDRKNEAISDLRTNVSMIGAAPPAATIEMGDYAEIDSGKYGTADLVVITGVLQHVKSVEELDERLRVIGRYATKPDGQIFIEMLFDMKFDGKEPSDGRLKISVPEFEQRLDKIFPSKAWNLSRVGGPICRKQDFSDGPRSFHPISRVVELKSVEYLLTRVFA